MKEPTARPARCLHTSNTHGGLEHGKVGEVVLEAMERNLHRVVE